MRLDLGHQPALFIRTKIVEQWLHSLKPAQTDQRPLDAFLYAHLHLRMETIDMHGCPRRVHRERKLEVYLAIREELHKTREVLCPGRA